MAIAARQALRKTSAASQSLPSGIEAGMTVTLTFMGFDLSTGSVVWPEVCTWRNGTIIY